MGKLVIGGGILRKLLSKRDNLLSRLKRSIYIKESCESESARVFQLSAG